MALPLLALAGGVFEAIDAVADLFDKGKEVYEAVTGQPSQASTPNELKAELAALPPEQAQAFLEKMRVEVEAHRAETDRLRVDEGEMTPEVLTAIGPEAAGRVALARMMTRPKIAMRAFHVLATPMYLMWIDAARLLVKDVSASWGGAYEPRLLVEVFFRDGSQYVRAYEAAAEWSAIIVLGYMTLRHFQKTSAQGRGLGDQVGTLVESVKGLFSRRR
jgi:hypothetical protein